MSRCFEHLRAFEARFVEEVQGEARLWRAVIIQAIADAQKNKTETFAHQAIRAEVSLMTLGINWFVSPGFEEVCDLADVEPGWLRARALGMIGEALAEQRLRALRRGTA